MPEVLSAAISLQILYTKKHPKKQALGIIERKKAHVALANQFLSFNKFAHRIGIFIYFLILR